MRDLQPELMAAVKRCYASGAFAPLEKKTGCPVQYLKNIKEKLAFKFESPLRGLAMEMLGLDVFKTTFRHIFKQPYAPLKPFVEAHFFALAQAYTAVLGEDEELAAAWYCNFLEQPNCGLSEEELTGVHSIFAVLPTMPFHQGLFTPRKGLRSAFESKIKRTDGINIFGMRGFPQTPWTQDDILASYLIGHKYPALWAGMRVWQFSTAMLAAALKDTALQMASELPKDWLGTYIEHLDMIAHVLVKAHFPLFILPGVALHLLEKTELPEKLFAEDVIRGLTLSMSQSVFVTNARADDGTSLKFTCPFASAGIRLLMLDTDGSRKNEARALPAFVLTMQNKGASQAYVEEIKTQCEKLLKRCNAKLVLQLKNKLTKKQKGH